MRWLGSCVGPKGSRSSTSPRGTRAWPAWPPACRSRRTRRLELADFAASLHIDLTVIGPELPLVLGIADEFTRRGLGVVGPSRVAAELEGSKVFTKEFCLRHGIPTARARVVRERKEAVAAIKEIGGAVVFKADGLAAGKGVLVCHDADDIDAALVKFFEERAFGAAGERVVVEECLAGEETSFMVLTDGATVVPLASARDYKRVADGDHGPNTGGMGSVSPAPLPSEVAATILRDIVHPTILGMAQEGRLYRGVLYAGVMLTSEGPKLLEYNCRLGDPETQAVIPRFDGDLLPLLQAAARGEFGGMRAAWKREACACVVLAAEGYPGSPRRGDPITGLAEALALDGVLVFQAGTAVAGRSPGNCRRACPVGRRPWRDRGRGGADGLRRCVACGVCRRALSPRHRRGVSREPAGAHPHGVAPATGTSCARQRAELDRLGVAWVAHVSSAHRTLERTLDLVRDG